MLEDLKKILTSNFFTFLNNKQQNWFFGPGKYQKEESQEIYYTTVALTLQQWQTDSLGLRVSWNLPDWSKAVVLHHLQSMYF